MKGRVTFRFVALALALILSSFLQARAQTGEQMSTPPQASQPAPPSPEERSFLDERMAGAPGQPETFNLIARTMGSLIIILGLIISGSILLRRFGLAKASPTMGDAPELVVLSSVTLGRERSLSVVRFGSRTLLIGSTPHAVTLLTEEESEEPAPVGSVADLLNEDFAAELERADALVARDLMDSLK
jgi:flagellar biogenesis protein FliO